MACQRVFSPLIPLLMLKFHWFKLSNDRNYLNVVRDVYHRHVYISAYYFTPLRICHKRMKKKVFFNVSSANIEAILLSTNRSNILVTRLPSLDVTEKGRIYRRHNLSKISNDTLGRWCMATKVIIVSNDWKGRKNISHVCSISHTFNRL